MRIRHIASRLLVGAVLATLGGCIHFEQVLAPNHKMLQSVVLIHVTVQSPDYAMPWQGSRPFGAKGTGFIVGKKRILTNAHMISDARLIEVQKSGESKRYQARVTFAAHDCDLAIITVDDDSFFEGTEPLPFAEMLPELNDQVLVVGYPLGGERLSFTRGIVSRIDYGLYSHSEVDQHLVLQVDAAINPGNSGGPVIKDGRVIGVAFQGIAWADNIGYAIPLPVIQRFLKDVEDGHYEGYPELGVAFMDGVNPALRADLGLPPDLTGVVAYYMDPFGSAYNLIQDRDVLLSIDGHPIDNDGSIEIDGNHVLFAEVLERLQSGQTVRFVLWRNKQKIEVPVLLKTPVDPFLYRAMYDTQPRYFVAGGLVFLSVNREYLRTTESAEGPNSAELDYYVGYAKRDGYYTNRDEYVVLGSRLPAEVNAYADTYINGVVATVNGVTIRKLDDVKAAFLSNTNTHHVLTFEGIQGSLVLDANLVKQTQDEICNQYGVARSEWIGAAP